MLHGAGATSTAVGATDIERRSSGATGRLIQWPLGDEVALASPPGEPHLILEPVAVREVEPDVLRPILIWRRPRGPRGREVIFPAHVYPLGIAREASQVEDDSCGIHRTARQGRQVLVQPARLAPCFGMPNLRKGLASPQALEV